MNIQLLLPFVMSSVLLTVMPGPDNIFVLTESITKGKKYGIAISIGLVLGLLIHTSAAATGVSVLLQNSALAFNIVKYLGATYLFYLAYQAWQEGEISTDYAVKNQLPFNWSTLIRKGFLMNVLNPKVSLFFIAFLPQFITPNGFNQAIQMIALGLIFMVQALLIFFIIAGFSSQLRPYLDNPKFWRLSKSLKIIVLVLIGFAIALAEH